MLPWPSDPSFGHGEPVAASSTKWLVARRRLRASEDLNLVRLEFPALNPAGALFAADLSGTTITSNRPV
jgi:hypothetical protein